jgi:hypothetical protein
MLTGCPSTSVDPPSSTGAGSGSIGPGTTSNEGVVEPLVPSGGVHTPAVSPADVEKKVPESNNEGTQLIPSLPSGKITSEVIPMPPIADLASQVDEYVGKLGKTLEDLDGTPKYKDDNEFIVRDANALALVVLAIGKSGNDSKYKKAAPGIIKAATELAGAGTFADAQKAYDALKTSLTSEGDPALLTWTKVADLKPLMKAVPNLSSLLTRLTNTESKLKRQMTKKPEQVFGTLAALAVISQGSIANVGDTSKPEAVDEWKKECEQFRDAAIKANTAAHNFADGKTSYQEYWNIYKELTETCDTCHKTFHPGAVGKNE